MITKSDYITYLRCNEKYFLEQKLGRRSSITLWTNFGHEVGKAAQDYTYENIFDLIDEVEDLKFEELQTEAYKLYPKGILATKVNNKVDWSTASEYTQRLITRPDVSIIYEAAFVFGKFACLVDILIRNGDHWDAYEVKSFLNTGACKKLHEDINCSIIDNGSWLDDITFQHFVIGNNPFVMNNKIKIIFHLMCLNKEYRFNKSEPLFVSKIAHQTADWQAPLFNNSKFDLQSAISNKLTRIQTHLQNMIDGVKSYKATPSICRKCEYKNECRGKDWGGWIWRSNKTQQNKKLSDLTENDCGNGKIAIIQKRMIEAMHKKQLIKDISELDKQYYGVNEYDRFIDFEGFFGPLPKFENQGPWEVMPCVFSWGSTTLIKSVIPPAGLEPRPALIKELCKIECPGRLFHYGNFDQKMIDHLIEYTDKILNNQPTKDKLSWLRHKMVDMQPAVQNSTYHPDWNFSFSLKEVGPYFSGKSYDTI